MRAYFYLLFLTTFCLSYGCKKNSGATGGPVGGMQTGGVESEEPCPQGTQRVGDVCCASMRYYNDNDQDDFGDPNASRRVCDGEDVPQGYVEDATDCDDDNPNINTNQVEVCDPANVADENCNGEVNEGFDLDSDVENCGVCGNVCDTEGGLDYSCVSGVCQFNGGCADGYWDVDGVVDENNGCEIACNVNPINAGASADGDDIRDSCDNCPFRSNPNQRDEDRNGVGDSCEGFQLALGKEHTCAIRNQDRKLVCWGPRTLRHVWNAPAGFEYSLVSVTAGSYHTCGLTFEGDAVCWGSNSHGQLDVPAGINFTSLSAGGFHTCGIDENNRAHCWGKDFVGQLSEPPNNNTFRSISVAEDHACGILLGNDPSRLQCWGNMDPRPSQSLFDSLKSKGFTTCGKIAGLDSIECWGLQSQMFVQGYNDLNFGLVGRFVIGSEHACATSFGDGTVECWGVDRDGRLNAPEGIALRSLSTGDFHTCGVRRDNHEIVCWGSSGNGKAIPDEEGSLTLFTQVSTGYQHACGIEVGTLRARCWGDDGGGFGDPTEIPESIRMQAISKIDTGTAHTCAVTSENVPVCWGDSSFGATQPPNVTARDVSLGNLNACLINSDTNEAQCFGRGAADVNDSLIAPQGIQFSKISLGVGFTACGIIESADNTDGTLRCWGDQAQDVNDLLYPPQNLRDEVVVDVTVGESHACVIKSDNTIECWGRDLFGQLDSPQGEYRSIDAGQDHTCAISIEPNQPVNGLVRCWGRQGTGQSPTPFEYQGSDFRAVSASVDFTCGVRFNGISVCWGSNGGGGNYPVPQEAYEP